MARWPRQMWWVGLATALLACLGCPAVAAEAPAKLRTFTVGEWYTVTCPEVLRVGTVAEITVAYRGIAEKTKLCLDLHFTKTDGTGGGFYSNDWRTKPDVQGEGKHTFTVPIHEQEGIASATILLFTEPNAQWGTHTRLARSEPIPVNDPDPGYSEWQKRVRWNKGWIGFDWSTLRGPLTEGDTIDVTVEYGLEPSDHYRLTTLTLEALGPRVPKPGAPKSVSFEETEHLYYGSQSIRVEPGTGKHTFRLTVPPAGAQNSLLLLAHFSESRGQRWPWDTRAHVWYARKGGFFELATGKPGNLFTYGEPVRLLARLKKAAEAGGDKVLRFTVHDSAGTQVAQGAVPFRADKEGQAIPVGLKLARRGTFVIRAEVDGWEARETTFCRIPDLAAITGGKRTRFGMTIHSAAGIGHRTEEVFRIARRLGMTTCRAFTEWAYFEPGPGVYRLQHWDPAFEAAHRNGVDTVICIWNPPAWVQPTGQYVGYRVFDCEPQAWKEMIRTVTRRYKGKFWGWEWLNEISPGGTASPAEDYVRLCRIGTETARAIDPSLRFSLAGGLWPRNYRLEVLNAGAGKYVDALPIHYGSGSGIQDAREDLDTFGHRKVAVWENESARPVITWGWPGREVAAETEQSRWVLTQWTDELAAGAEKLIYFGGEGDAIGDWDYLYADHSPRPVAATLAVFAAKMAGARPMGVFASLGKSGLFYAFERAGKALLVASTGEAAGETVRLSAGAASVRVTDYQGNETTVAARNGAAALPLSAMPCFVEGADLDVVRAYLVPAAGGKREQAGVVPQVSVLRGQAAGIPFRLRNPFARRLAGTLSLDVPAAWAKRRTVPFSLAPGESRLINVPVRVPGSTAPGAFRHKAAAAFAWKKLLAVAKPFVVSVISRESVGNLLRNGGFEDAEPDGVTPRVWQGTNGKLAAAEGLGLGKRVLRFGNAAEWGHYGQTLELRGGTDYLYTAWIWNQGMEGGSNIGQLLRDGTRSDLYNKQVMDIGDSTPYWQLFTCRYKAPAGLKSASFVPALRGSGWCLFDNMRVTAFEGTDFTAEAFRVRKAPAIDGRLDDWDRKCPIPLIGKSQLRVAGSGYQWTPTNLNGVAYLAWDKANLYVAVEVKDDVHRAAGDGEGVIQGDSLVLAFDPTNRAPEASRRAFAYYLSSRKPGIGSGRHTLWRPQRTSGGRPAGHLARDSSVYDLAIRPGDGGCVYELRIPLSEMGGVAPAFGSKMGFAIQLNDNDGAGPAAQMTWGGGLWPTWSPSGFGLITLVE